MSRAKKVIKNLFSLTVADVASKGIVFITTTYLARVLQPDGFGIIGYANSFVAYFLIFVNLGFNIFGVREVSKSPFTQNIKNYVNNIVTIRGAFAVISYFLFFLIILFIDKPEEVKFVLLITGFNLFSNALMLDWVFIGLERMEIQAIRQLITGTLNLIGIYIFVNERTDTALAAAIFVIATAVNACWIFLYYLKLYKNFRFELNFSLWKRILKSSFPIGLTNLSVILYSSFSILILGFFRTYYETGVYDAAFRFYSLTMMPIGIIQGAFLPLLSRSSELGEKQAVMEKYNTLLFLVGAIVCGSIFTFSEPFSNIVFGDKFIETGWILKFLMLSSMLAFFNQGHLMALSAWNRENLVLKCIAVSGLASVALNLIFTPIYGTIAAASISVFCEFLTVVLFSIFTYKLLKKFYFFKLLKFVGISAIASLLGYIAFKNGVHSIFSTFLSFSIYIFFIIKMKIVNLQEVISYFKKKEKTANEI